MSEPLEFLTAEEVAIIHEEQVRRYGGSAGIRDVGLLESAVTAPEFAAHYSGADVFWIAATYVVLLIRDHPFVDGNKRTGVVAARVSLRLNGIRVSGDARFKRDLEHLAVRVAERRVGEEDVAILFRRWAARAFRKSRKDAGQ